MATATATATATAATAARPAAATIDAGVTSLRPAEAAGPLMEDGPNARGGGGQRPELEGAGSRNPVDSGAARRLTFDTVATAAATTRVHQPQSIPDHEAPVPAAAPGGAKRPLQPQPQQQPQQPQPQQPQAQGADLGGNLKVLNFNVFAGSPLPFFANYTSSESLEDSRRLQLQIEKIRALAPDIVCLQEVCADGVQRYYQEALGALGYDGFSESQPPEALGVVLLYLLYALVAGVLSFALHCSIDAVVPWSPASRSASRLWLLWWGADVGGGSTSAKGALVFLALFLKSLLVAVLVMRKTCLAGFLGGTVKASMVIFWRRDRLQPWTAAAAGAKPSSNSSSKVGTTTLFTEQRGDWLNLLRPRGYLSARLDFRGLSLWVVNTHLNLGPAQYRRRQIEELAAHCQRLGDSGSVLLCGDFNAEPESEEIRMLREGAGLVDALAEQGCSEPTWTARNPLTHGILIEEDHRCDYVMYRALREKHRLLNRCCRLAEPFFSNTWLSDHFAILTELSLQPLTADP